MHLHLIFVGVTLVGGVLFLSWAIKMKTNELKQWTLWLLVVGILGVLLTSAFSGFGRRMKVFHAEPILKSGSPMMNGQAVPGVMLNQ